MLLDNEAGGARSERVLVAAQIRGGAGFGDAARNFENVRLAAADVPNAEDVSFAISHGDDAVRRNLDGARDGLVDDRLHVGCGELRLGERGPEDQANGKGDEEDASFHGGALILKLHGYGYEKHRAAEGRV